MRTEMDGDIMKVTLGSPMYRGGAIKGAPYSGEQVSEDVRTLADGTHITQPPRIETLWRDSQGRTRSERTMNFGFQQEKGAFVLVQINDPVGGYVYAIDDVNKVAYRSTIARPAERKPQTAAVKQPVANDTQSSREQLGEKNIEGVIARGIRLTTTSPVGTMGNDRPLVTTHETWYSNELGTYVLTTRSDALMGESTTKLINISRAEPDAALFLPPAGYQVVDEKDSFTVTLKRQ